MTASGTVYSDDIDPVLAPLLEEPTEWFQEPPSQYETAFGPFGGVFGLTPHYVRFSEMVRADQYPDIEQFAYPVGDNPDILSRDVKVVDNYEQATTGPNNEHSIAPDKPVVWVRPGDTMLTIYEQVPFGEENRVTTPGELRSQLNEIMDNTPDWSEIFRTAGDVIGAETAWD